MMKVVKRAAKDPRANNPAEPLPSSPPSVSEMFLDSDKKNHKKAAIVSPSPTRKARMGIRKKRSPLRFWWEATIWRTPTAAMNTKVK